MKNFNKIKKYLEKNKGLDVEFQALNLFKEEYIKLFGKDENNFLENIDTIKDFWYKNNEPFGFFFCGEFFEKNTYEILEIHKAMMKSGDDIDLLYNNNPLYINLVFSLQNRIYDLFHYILQY